MTGDRRRVGLSACWLLALSSGLAWAVVSIAHDSQARLRDTPLNSVPAGEVTDVDRSLPRSIEGFAAPAAAISDQRSPKAAERGEQPTIVRVVVRLAEDALTLELPEPELLRLDVHGVAWPVAALERSAPELVARDTMRRGNERVAAFEVDRRARYCAAWHLWRRVGATRTLRVCRGRAQPLELGRGEGSRELVVYVSRRDLEVDPRLDAPIPEAETTLRPKDGW